MSKGKRLIALGGTVLFLILVLFPLRPYQGQAGQVAMAAAGRQSYLPMIARPKLVTPSPTAAPPAAPGTAFTFVSWADTKSGTAALAALSGQVKNLHPAFTLYPGDLVNGFTTSAANTWKNALNGNNNNGMYDITMELRGNHDAGNTSGWQSYFNTSGVASRIGATHFNALSNNLTYAFTYSNAIFIGIDVPGDASLITSGEVSFLDGALTDAESRGLTHAFIFFHGPVYTISSHTSCPTRTCATPASVVSLVKVLNKHSIVSAIFNGHEHLQAYIHMDSSRMPEITHPFEEFITGSGGAELYSCNKTFRFDFCGSYAGFAGINVSGKTFTVSIYRQNQAGPVKTYTFTKP